MPGALLELRGIGKSFPGVRALAGVDLDVRAGEIHAIVGENGAGKSTLMNVLSGVYPPDEGALVLDGAAVRFKDPRDAQDHGVAMIHQELSLAPHLTVATPAGPAEGVVRLHFPADKAFQKSFADHEANRAIVAEAFSAALGERVRVVLETDEARSTPVPAPVAAVN